MMNFALILRSLDEFVSEVTHRDSSIESPTHGECVATAQTNIYATDKIDALPNERLRAPPPNGPYVMHVQ